MVERIVIVGGVAGGATAAARARRLDESAEIILLERGAHISFANCGLPYYLSGVIGERDDLFLTTPDEFTGRYNIDVRVLSRVESVNRKNKEVLITNLTTGKEYWQSYDKLILSPGAEPILPPLEGIDLPNIFTLRNVPDADRIKKRLDEIKPESAVVVGAGFIGLEMAESLVERGVKTRVVEMLPQVMPPLDFEMAALVELHLKEKGVRCELGDGVTSFSRQGDKLVVNTSKGLGIDCDLVILSVGVRPENKLAAEAGLDLGDWGGIKVDQTMKTSDPHIYAVGDAVEVTDYVTGFPTITALAGPANKQGRIAADNALGRRSVFRGTIGSAVVKVFDLTVSSTGANEKSLEKKGIPCRVSYTHSGSHASYYPGASVMAIKLIYSPGSGRVLGAQIIGQAGVEKRMDVIATAIKGAMTVFDLEELELTYAPPYSSAKDPVNVAGFVAANILKSDMEIITWREMGALNPEVDVILDLRFRIELKEAGTIKGAVHIPLPRLRKKMGNLDRNKTYILFCAVGYRAYVAYRILAQNGFSVKVFSGGYITYSAVKGELEGG